MSTINATIVGRLARDPESKTTGGGTTLTTCTIPVDTGWGDSKSTTWWRVTIFGKKAEVVAKHLAKGRSVAFSGPVSVREYTKKDGSKGFSAEMTASDFAFVGSKGDDSNQSSGSGGGGSRGASSSGRQSGGGDLPFDDDSIPF